MSEPINPTGSTTNVNTTQQSEETKIENKKTGAELDKTLIAANLKKYEGYIDAAAKKYNVPKNLIVAIMINESGGNPDAKSPTGCKGIMQLYSGIYKSSEQFPGEIDPFDPAQAIDRGANYLSDLRDHYHGDLEKVVAAYNQGQTKIDKAVAQAKSNGDESKWKDSILPEGQKYIINTTDILTGNNGRVNETTREMLDGGAEMVKENKVPSAEEIQEMYEQMNTVSMNFLSYGIQL